MKKDRFYLSFTIFFYLFPLFLSFSIYLSPFSTLLTPQYATKNARNYE